MLTTLEPTQNLGKVKFGKPHGFIYIVKNSGDKPLEITRLGVGCTSCTTASTDKTKLAPGEETVIKAVFTPGSVGPHHKHINVQWDVTNVLKLSFTAESYA